MKNAPAQKHCRQMAKNLAFLGFLTLAACATPPGPSVPYQPGKNLAAARSAVQSCARFAPKGGNNMLIGSYAAGFILGGVVVGPIIVASDHKDIRAMGEANAVDKCLAQNGYVRRDLTAAEMQALNASGKTQREMLLNHFVGGGTLDTLQTRS